MGNSLVTAARVHKVVFAFLEAVQESKKKSKVPPVCEACEATRCYALHMVSAVSFSILLGRDLILLTSLQHCCAACEITKQMCMTGQGDLQDVPIVHSFIGVVYSTPMGSELKAVGLR